MAKVCEVCGRGPQFRNRVSHAHNVTKRRWDPEPAERACGNKRRGEAHSRLHVLHP